MALTEMRNAINLPAASLALSIAIASPGLGADYIGKADMAQLCDDADHVSRERLAMFIFQKAALPYSQLFKIGAHPDAWSKADMLNLISDPCLGVEGDSKACSLLIEDNAEVDAKCAMVLADAGSGGGSVAFCRRRRAFLDHSIQTKELNTIQDALRNQFFGLNTQLTLPSNNSTDPAPYEMSREFARLVDREGEQTPGVVLFACQRSPDLPVCMEELSADAPTYVFAVETHFLSCVRPKGQVAQTAEETHGEETGTPGPGERKSQGKKRSLLSGLKNARLRGEIGDLNKDGIPATIPPAKRRAILKDFKELSAATISYREDEKAHSSTFAIKGVAGLPIDLLPADPNNNEKLLIIPFAQYERGKTSSPAKKSDTHLVSPGVQLFYDSLFPAAFSLTALYTFDLEQQARKATGRADLSGALNSWQFFGRTVESTSGGGPFSGQVAQSGVYIRPNWLLGFEASDVLDAGTSAVLAKAQSYYGVGGKFDITIGAYTPEFLSNFIFKAKYEHLEFVAGDISLDRAARFAASLNYSPPGAEYFFLKFEYVNGENMTSFQEEENFNVSLGVRY